MWTLNLYVNKDNFFVFVVSQMKHKIQPKIFYLSVFIYNLYIIHADILLIFNANIFYGFPF